MNYAWTRFWKPKNSTTYLSDDRYLYDPQKDMGRYYNKTLTEIDKIESIGCLVLLGEAGSGKTTEIYKEWRSLKKANIDKTALCFDLGEYSDEHRLCSEIFNNDCIQQWVKSNDFLYLFLDSFDECFLRIETLPTMLLNKLDSLPCERLYLRIACRGNIWPSFLEGELKHLWPSNSETYVLAPLRRSDVEQAAVERGVGGSRFLKEVRRLGLEALARKPATLEMLFQLYDEKESLSESSEDIYYQCCSKLCMELNPRRYGLKVDGKLTIEERLAIASRIAAISIFGDRSFVVKEGSLKRVTLQYTLFEDLCGGQETTNLEKVVVGRDEVKETLELTGLFQLETDNTLAWIDENFTCFLAAIYLKRRGLSISELNDLVIHQGYPELKSKRVVPQLEKTVEWLVSMIPEFRTGLLKIDPIVVLKSDLSQVDQTELGKIAISVLEYYKKPGIPSSFRSDAFQHYYKLRHSNLAKQLAKYIANLQELEKVRIEAILIASECDIQDVQQEVLSVAIDAKESIYIRGLAIKALTKIAENEVKLELKDLLKRDESIDSEDELKGSIFRCLWPKLISAQELFSQLTPRKRKNLIGSYHMFLRYDLIQHIRKEDIPYVLSWLATNEDEEIADNIENESIYMSMEYLLTDDQIFQCFVHLLTTRIKKYEHIVPSSIEVEFSGLLDNTQKLRFRILKAVLDRKKTEWVDLVYSKPAIMRENDISWLLSKIQSEGDPEKQKYMARLISWLVDSRKSETIVAIYDTLKDKAYLQENFRWLFGTIELSSQEAESVKKEFYQRREWEERNQQRNKTPRVLEDSFTQDQLTPIIGKFYNGDLLVWKEIDGILNCNCTNEQKDYSFGSDVTAFPRWQKIDTDIKADILKIASSYVEQWAENPTQWRNTDSFSTGVFSDYRALRLALEFDSARLEGVAPEIWRKWAPFVLWYPVFGDLEKNSEHKRKIIKQFYDKVPDKVIEELMDIIDYQNAKGNIFILEDMKYCWNENLQHAIINKLKSDETLQENCLSTLLDTLLQQKVEEAFYYAQNLLASSEISIKKIIAADAVLRNGGLAQWQLVWPIINKDRDFAKRVILEIASRAPYQKYEFMNYLTPDNFAELYILMCELFPYEDDQKDDMEDHTVGPREQAAHFRDGLLNRLKSWGTWSACLAIGKIRKKVDCEWLDYSVYEAIQQVLIKTKRTFQIVDILSWDSTNKRGILMKDKTNKDKEQRKKKKAEDNVMVNAAGLTPFKILHLSDLHIGESTNPLDLLQPLVTDLRSKRGGFYYEKVDCVVISGDITRKGKKAEFEIAQDFVEMLMKEVGVDGSRCVIVPGNHDMDWDVEVYSYKKQIDSSMTKERYIEEGSGYLVRNDSKYFERFLNFSTFYKNITKRDYPTSYQAEGVIYPFTDLGIQILGFNSCWEIDENNPKRISVNSGAVSKCLMEALELDKENEKENRPPIGLRIAVMHHPVNGKEMISNDAILDRLSSAEVRLLLHGHVHVECDEIRNHHNRGKRLVVAGTGTLGAKSSERPASAPYLYSVLEVYQDMRLKVSVRSKDTEDGTWEGRSRWQGTTPSDSTYYYEENLAY